MKKFNVLILLIIYLSVNIQLAFSKNLNSLETNFNEKENIFKDEIILNPDTIYSSGFIKNTPTYFRIKLDDINKISNLNIYFTVLSGNADIYVFSDNEHKHLVEKKNFRYAYKKEVIEIYEDFIENYYISIVLHESSFIEIKYNINSDDKDYILLNNEVNIEYLNREEDYKNYTINTESETNYLLIRSPFCSLNFQSGETEETNITYKYFEFSGKEYKFNLQLNNYFHTVYDDKEDCTIFISTGDISNSQSNPLLIPESIPNPSLFINTYYSFPFVYDEYFKGIFINFEFDSETPVESNISPEVAITFIVGEQQTDYEVYTIRNSKIFFIKSNIEKYCKINNICNLQIQLENKESSSSINTIIKLSTLSPKFASKNKVYEEKMLSQGSTYFYTEIDEDEEGEINIMFNKGNGKIFAKIVEKNIFEENANWNRRIILPEENSENLLNFDSIKGSLKYYARNYNNCANGCELYLLVKGFEEAENENTLNDFSFSIDKRRNDIEQNGVVNLLLNNYIKGNLTSNDYKYYTFTINFDIKKISINFYSAYGELYIKLGKGHIANKEVHDWELTNPSNDQRIIISCEDEKIGYNSLKGISFSLGIIKKSYINEDNINLYYFLQVQTLHNDLVDYYYLQSERSIICNTSEFEYCNILLPLPNLDDNQDIVIYASSMINEEQEINVLSKYYSEEEIDNIDFTESISGLFPTQENYEQNSNGEKYLLLKNNKIKANNYFLITIYAKEKNNLIKVILSSNSNYIRASLPPFTERLLYINYNKKANLTILDNNHPAQKYTLNIRTISGISELTLGENDYYSELDGNYINEISPDYSTPMLINNINDNKEPNIIIVSFSEFQYGTKGYDLIKNINNEISFSLSEDPFPQYGFIDMKNKSILINIFFYNITLKPYSHSRITENLFNIYSMLLPDYEEQFDVLGNYLIYENIGVVNLKINKGKITDEGYYVYNFIQKAYGNENLYKTIKEQITVSELDSNNEIRIFPKSKYFYSLDENDNKINLVLTNKNKDIIFLIDIVENMPVLNNLGFKLYRCDGSEIDNYKSYDYLGKKRIIVNNTNKNNEDKGDIKLTIEKNANFSTPKNITLQYFTYQDDCSIVEYKDFNNTFYIQESENRTNFTFNNIFYYYKNNISNVVYFIEVLNKSEDYDSFDKIDTVFLGNFQDNNSVFNNIIDWLKEDYKSYTQYIPKDLNFTNDTYFIRIVASFINNNGYEERIIYKLFEPKEDDDSESESKRFIIFLIVCGTIILIAIIFIILISIKMRNIKKELRGEKDIEPIGNLEESKNEDLIEEKN